MTSLALARALIAAPRRGLHSSRSFSALVQADYEYPGLPSLSPQAAKASSISVSTLPSGLIVVTEDASTTATVTLTFPKAGSASEMLDEQGAALTNKAMNFKSGSGLSTILINRTIEDEGGSPFSMVDRKGATVGFTVAPEKAVGLIPLLATDCTFEKWDVRDAKAHVMTESKAASESAQIVLTENLFAAAYGPQSPAGRPLYGMACSTPALKDFRARAYGLNGAVLSATGVKDHSAFCTQAETLLADSPKGTADPAPGMTYLGGESRVAVPGSGFAHVAIAFAAPESTAVSNVLVKALGLAGVSAFSSCGLVGVYSGTDSPSTVIESLVTALKTKPSADVIKRAKILAKAEAIFALDGGSKSLAYAMTSSVLESGTFTGAADVAKSYDGVSDKMITDALAAMIKSNPSLAAVGDIAALPYQATVAAALK